MFKVNIGYKGNTGEYRYFDTLDEAKAFVQEAFARKNVVLSIVSATRLSPKRILEVIKKGGTVTYTVRRLRGYLHGDASLVFGPGDVGIGLINIAHRLKCFRADEAPYDKPRWDIN